MSNNQFHFLISSERGGSNLISRMLDSHSLISAPSPTHLFRTLIPLSDGQREWSEIIELAVQLFNLKLSAWEIEISKEELTKNVEKNNLTALLQYIYIKQANNLNKSVSFIKEVRTYNLIPFILENFPHAKFIYIVRDPRDMALSWKQSPIHKGEIVRGTNVWNKDQTRSLIDYFNLIAKNKIYIVKYENLISDAKKELLGICDFLNLKFEDKMLDYHEGESEKSMSKATDNWKNLNKPLLTNNFNKYKKSLSVEEIKYIEYINYELMEYFKYVPEFDKVDSSTFERIKKIVEVAERSEKPEYLNVSSEERAKREEWMKLVKSINKLNIF